MCGFAGLYHLQRRPIPAHCLKPMCDAIVHRGPDDEGAVYFHVRNEPFKSEGYWVEQGNDRRNSLQQLTGTGMQDGTGEFNLALGHRRLAVIDLSPAGHQPMSNRANGIWITYNGEIYNYRELRRELQAAGHHFFSQTDTEVIIHLYEQYGDDAIGKLNGIFAFALWDGRKNRLILARDRYGAKPLYYTIKNDLLAFGSEIKSLLKVDGIKPQLNFQALSAYFTFQNTYGEMTLFNGINLLEQGTYLVFEEGAPIRRKYWDYNFHEGPDRGEDFYADQLKTLLSTVIDRQLVADVPVGSYLSGGLDSGTITALASRTIPRLMTFTGGFDIATATSIENFFDERQKAEMMSREFGTEHYQMVIHAGDLEWALPRVVWHTEDLRVGMSYPHYYLSQLASKFVKVVLAGAGGDEIFAGYPWRYDLLDSSSSDRMQQSLYQYWSRLVHDSDKPQFFTPETIKRIGGYRPYDSFSGILQQTAGDTGLKQALHFDARTFLHGILVVEDKLSMAHSLESRVPFLDNELVNLAMQIPSKYLINRNWSDEVKHDINLSGKYILRRAMTGTLPNAIIENRKQGFSAPDQSWYMHQLVEYVRSTILSERSLDRGYFQRDYLERILNEHMSGQINHRLLIWSLLSFEWWNRLFIDGDPVESAMTQRVIFRKPQTEATGAPAVVGARYRSHRG